MLAAELRGARDEVVEIISEPMLMSSYGISLDQMVSGFLAMNTLTAAGALEGSTGRFPVGTKTGPAGFLRLGYFRP